MQVVMVLMVLLVVLMEVVVVELVAQDVMLVLFKVVMVE